MGCLPASLPASVTCHCRKATEISGHTPPFTNRDTNSPNYSEPRQSYFSFASRDTKITIVCPSPLEFALSEAISSRQLAARGGEHLLCLAFNPMCVHHVLSPTVTLLTFTLTDPGTHAPIRSSQAELSSCPIPRGRACAAGRAGCWRQSAGPRPLFLFSDSSTAPSSFHAEMPPEAPFKTKGFCLLRKKKKSLQITGVTGRIWAGSLSPRSVAY